jgi:hypothetical protein
MPPRFPLCVPQVRPVETGSVALSQVVTEEQLVERSEAFENAVTGRDRTSLQASVCWRSWCSCGCCEWCWRVFLLYGCLLGCEAACAVEKMLLTAAGHALASYTSLSLSLT